MVNRSFGPVLERPPYTGEFHHVKVYFVIVLRPKTKKGFGGQVLHVQNGPAVKPNHENTKGRKHENAQLCRVFQFSCFRDEKNLFG
jgi:hypothetical protein